VSAAARPPQDVYSERVERFEAERHVHARRSDWISRGRIVTFAAAVALLVWAETGGWPAGRTLGGAALLVLFLALLAWHRRERRSERRSEALRRLNEEGLARLVRDWGALPTTPIPPPPGHAFAGDLDVAGRASLLHLLGSVSTVTGRSILADWLLRPAPPNVVRERQAAVRELAPLLELREELAVRGRLGGDVPPAQLAGFLDWAEGPGWLLERRALLWLSRLLPPLLFLLAALHLAGVTDFPFWQFPLLAHIALMFIAGQRIHGIFARAFPGAAVFRNLPPAIQLVAEAPFRSAALKALQGRLHAGPLVAHRQLKRLERIMELADTRRNMFHVVLHLLTLWDFHVLFLLERWQSAAGPHARAWLRALGEAEALSALATLAFDHPGWTFPEVDRDALHIEGRGLGHPLLPPDRRVDNDVRVGPAGTFLLVTGSNMSGKSTLLRALGLNVVLAQAGAPVCAAALRLPPVTLETSMRVQDSLEEGVSYFMAVIRRLKEIVDRARAAQRGETPPLLYLLDEILQGTNTAERQVASRRIIRFLIDRGAYGVVTTHDLELAETPELEPFCDAVHLRETVEERDGRLSMTFDYRLRPGVATSTNALRLMQIVGLDVGQDVASGPAADQG
jgi:hypothetical protein